MRDDQPFWTPPGGGVEFGEPLESALRREVAEETGVDVEVGPLRYVVDFVRPPLHAVSFYFSCRAANLDAAKLGPILSSATTRCCATSASCRWRRCPA